MLDDFDNFDSLFDKLWNNFTRPVLDQKPFKVKQVDKGFIIVVNTLGIDKKDLTVSLTNEKGRPYPVLKIVGETNLSKINFKNNINLGISLRIDNKVKDISYKCENGLTTIFIETEEVKQAIERQAKLVDENDSSLDW